MRYILALTLVLILATSAYADKTISVTLTDEEYKAFEWQVNSPEEWIEHAVNNKIRKSENRMLLELTDKRPDKLTKQERKDLIKNSTLKTKKEKDN